MLIIPAMDLIDNQVVRLEQGDYSKVTVYHREPLTLAKQFYEAGISRLHLVDLSGAKAGKPVHTQLFNEIKQATNVVIEAGGGLRSLSQVTNLFTNGLVPKKDFAMIGSLPFLNRAEFNKICDEYPQSILPTIDVWGTEIRIAGWQKDSGTQIFDFINEMLMMGLTEFLVTQIKKDGMMSGPDYQLYQELLKKSPSARFIASGGVSCVDDLKKLRDAGLYAAILGKAFYEGKVTLDDVAQFT